MEFAKDATVNNADLKAQFHHLCRKWHPDKNKGNSSSNKMSKIIDARRILHTELVSRNGKPLRVASMVSSTASLVTAASKREFTNDATTNIKRGSIVRLPPPSKRQRAADAQIVSLLYALNGLGLAPSNGAPLPKNFCGVSLDLLEATYKQKVVLWHPLREGQDSHKSICEEKLADLGISRDRILLSIDFEKYWKPPYDKSHQRETRALQDSIFFDNLKQEKRLEHQRFLKRHSKTQETQETQGLCKDHKKVDDRQKVINAEHATHIWNSCGVEFASQHAKGYMAHINQQRKMQFQQQSAALHQHVLDYKAERDALSICNADAKRRCLHTAK